ncbi:MAG: pyroglutamyl-peptidase I [Clostridia bacterium]|nr:pyroglutamyl-peptidase I [Clostridia bacterium]
MKKLLITGFEAFGGERINPSWEAVSRLPEEIGKYSVIKLCIPVEYGRAAEKVISVADRVLPDVILCVGQAGGRAAVTPELVGINLRHSELSDNAGYQPSDEPIIRGGAAAYFSTLPVRKMADAVNAKGIPAKVSYSAGAYVCNDTLYTLLAHFENSPTRVGFIHIPYCTAQAKEPAMEIGDIILALTVAVESIE